MSTDFILPQNNGGTSSVEFSPGIVSQLAICQAQGSDKCNSWITDYRDMDLDTEVEIIVAPLRLRFSDPSMSI